MPVAFNVLNQSLVSDSEKLALLKARISGFPEEKKALFLLVRNRDRVAEQNTERTGKYLQME